MSDQSGSGGGWGGGEDESGRRDDEVVYGWGPGLTPPPTPPHGPPPPGATPPPAGAPPQGPPPAYQPHYPSLPVDQQQYRYGPAYGSSRPPGKSRSTTIVVIVLVVLLAFIVLFGLSCWGCARGCQRMYEEVRENSYTITRGGETRWFWQGSPQARDTAPPDAGKDAQTLAGGEKIRRAIEEYSVEYGEYPSETEVVPSDTYAQSPNRFSGFVTTWPINPWTNRRMDDSPHRGDYLYVRWNDGTYTLRVFLSSEERDL